MLTTKEVYFNLETVIASNKIKIGDVEAKAGISHGYISRVKKSANSYPSVELLDAVSSLSNISIDALLNIPFFSLTNTESYIARFIEKVIRDSQIDMLSWKRKTVDELNKEIATYTYEGDLVCFPILSIGDSIIGESGYPEAYETYYKSNFAEHENCVVVSSVLYCSLNGSVLYIVPVKDPSKTMIGYDLYLETSAGVDNLCCTSENQENVSGLNITINHLVREAEQNSKRIHLNESVSSAINAFMNPSSQETGTDDDDDLPF
ncbi:MAG: helix-turn-helix domain-containing protein [Eubacterium coprostanoligenes]|nr:helix-turn-helix domain-containing protein [Eubacterium coprostanoligenes]